LKVNAKTLFEKAYGNFCIPAINISNPEQVTALFATAQKHQAPFIVQSSPAAREYISAKMILSHIETASRIYPDVVYAVHLDHGNEYHVHDAIASGQYTSVMIDASHDPLEQNITRTKKVVQQAHPKNISVEAELGILSGVEDDLEIDKKNALFTDPKDVVTFVEETGCDSLAVAVGTSHGAYKFSGGHGLRFDLLAKIQSKLPNFPIVLHGASQIDPDEVKRINNAGGSILTHAKGITDDEIKKAIVLGVCKLNIATDLRLLWTRIFREYFRDHSGEWDHLIPGKKYMKGLEKLIHKKFRLLNCVNKNHLFK
jgi:fructose-bisphosphate aldolase class II